MKESHSTSDYRKFNNTIKKAVQEAYRVVKDITTERGEKSEQSKIRKGIASQNKMK